MLETYFSTGKHITKSLGDFPGTTFSAKWRPAQQSIEFGSGFFLLSDANPLSILYREEQKKYGYSAENGSLILFDYGKEHTNEFYDDPFQKFLRLGLALSIRAPHKILPVGFAVLNDTTSLDFYRPRNFLSADDYGSLSSDEREIALKSAKDALQTYEVLDNILSKSMNTKINDALTYYIDYLKTSDPKIELVLLTMILEVLFIEDDSSVELQTKLMTRLSRFLLPKVADRKRRFDLSDFIKGIYDIRSSVLHGSEYKKILARKARSAEVSPDKYLSSHISELDDIVIEVISRILKSEKELALMSSYPRGGNDKEIKDLYQALMLG